MRKLKLAAGLAILVAGCSGQDPSPVFHQSEGLKRSGIPISNAVEVRDVIYLSGKLGTVPGKGFVERGVEPETRQTMDNIKAELEGLGLTMNDVVKCTVMLVDMAEWPKFNEIYKSYFTEGSYPARSAFATSGLAANARVEVECMAVRR